MSEKDKNEKHKDENSTTNILLTQILYLLQQQSQSQAQNNTDTISNVGNPTINISASGGSSSKENKNNKEKCCECSGFAIATVDDHSILIDICKDCRLTSENFLSVFGPVINVTALTFNPPSCFTVGENLIFATSGIGLGDGVYQGTYSVILVETPGGNDDGIVLSFGGFDSTGALLANTYATATIPDGSLSITKCAECDSSCIPSPKTLESISEFLNSMDKKRKVHFRKKILRANGEMEVIEG